MDLQKLQFSFLFSRDDGSLHGTAFDAAANEHVSYVIWPDGRVYEHRDLFSGMGWRFLTASDSDTVRSLAVHSQRLVPRYAL